MKTIITTTGRLVQQGDDDAGFRILDEQLGQILVQVDTTGDTLYFHNKMSLADTHIFTLVEHKDEQPFVVLETI